jgi:MFS-type transporter involved in bile tolerance (Atg22 family)
MHVALYDVDSLIPNLALMKISAFHKDRGDTVTRFAPLFKDQ